MTDAKETSLLQALGDRPATRVYTPWTGSLATWQFGSPDLNRNFLPVTLSAGSGHADRVLAAPGLVSSQGFAAEISAEVPDSEENVFGLLMLAALARTNRDVDGIVVPRSTLERQPLAKVLASQCYTPTEAIALLRLVLRAHGDYAVARDGNTTYSVPGEAFYRAVAHQHLWTLEPWIKAAAGHWLQGSHESMTRLNGVVRRITRGLRARDYLQVRLRAPEFSYVWDEVMFFLDVVLVELMGAFDVLGRFFHHLYGIKHDRSISWRRRGKEGWLSGRDKHEPRLGFYARPGQPFGDVVDAVAVLRNLIHDAPPTDEIHDWDGRPGTMVYGAGVLALRLGRESATLLRAASRQGGLVSWGLSTRSDEKTVLLDPGLFAEQSLRLGTKAIAEALGLADRGRLGGEEIDDVSHWVPPANYQANAAALYGLDRGGYRQERVTFG